MNEKTRVIRTGETHKDTRGFLSAILFLITLGNKMVEYEKEKVLVLHEFSPFRMVTTMEGDYEVFYDVKRRKVVDTPTKK